MVAPKFFWVVWTGPLPDQERCSTPEAKIVCYMENAISQLSGSTVLCFYSAHRKELLRAGLCNKKVHIVDRSQGSEFNQPTILSAGRHDGKIGFLGDRRRVCVALTRTTQCVVIVIHKSLLAPSVRPALWRKMYDTFYYTDVVCEIDYEDLWQEQLKEFFTQTRRQVELADYQYLCESQSAFFNKYQHFLIRKPFKEIKKLSGGG